MALGKSAAVVIGSFDLGESDRVITFYSREYGKVRGVAKASRRMRSRFGGALELFTLGQLVFFDTGRSDLVRAALARRGRRDLRGVRSPGAGRNRHQPGRGGRAGTPAHGALGGGAGPAPRPRRGRATGGAGSTHDTTDRPADAHREVPARGAAAVRDDRRAAMRHLGVWGPCRGRSRVIEARPGFAGARRGVGVWGPCRGRWRVIEARHGFAGARRAVGVWGPFRGPQQEL